VPGAQERVLRTRIRTVQATKKITRAMELIAASRIVRAQGRVAAARPYSEKVTEVIANLARGGAGLDHALLRQPESVSKVAYIVVAADRGLAGGYNNNVLRTTERAIAADRQAGRDYELVLSGKKAVGYFRFRRYRIAADFQGYSDTPTYADAARLGQAAGDLFYGGEVQQVRLVYTQFLSAGSQQVTIVPFMPLDPGSLGLGTPAGEDAHAVSALYEFEPDPDTILGRLLPSYAGSRLYSALLEASASEHAARQRAMKSATDNAEDLITTLTRVLNRARQDAITTEIMEIVGGAEALKQGGQLVNTDLLEDRIEGRQSALFSAPRSS
jgi:F-type H+-transporting ATPase subunit gamma